MASARRKLMADFYRSRKEAMMSNQNFGVGDIVTDGNFKMKVVMPIQDEDGSWFYECEALDFEAPFTREIPQEHLKAI